MAARVHVLAGSPFDAARICCVYERVRHSNFGVQVHEGSKTMENGEAGEGSSSEKHMDQRTDGAGLGESAILDVALTRSTCVGILN